MKRQTSNAYVLQFLVGLVGILPGLATADAASDCAAMRDLRLDNTTITSASMTQATAKAPEYCKVVGHVDTEVAFELRLPTGWNNRFVFQGYGGLDGAAPSVTQELSLGNPGQPPALNLGFAVVTTDTGHRSEDGSVYTGSWAYQRPDRQVNWAYRSTHVVAEAAKSITRAFYRQAPAYSYYVGCSGSGRHGAMSASRYPKDFDGIIASAPFLSPALQVVSFNWTQQALARQPIAPAKLQLITKAAVAACDANDGVVDGLITDSRRCNFDPSSLKCTAGDQASCLTDGEVDTLKKLYAGPRNSKGAQLFPGWEAGAEATLWPGSLVHTKNGGPGELLVRIPDEFLKYFVFGPGYDTYSFNFDTDLAALAPARELFDVKPDLTEFARAGGKMLTWHGWLDPRLSLRNTITFHDTVARNLPPQINGRRSNIDDFYRLFIAPGVGHCGSGPGPNTFDALTALQNWVEKGVAPQRIIASHLTDGVVDRTRPLCPYPQEAVYMGSGDTNKAENFVCKDSGNQQR